MAMSKLATVIISIGLFLGIVMVIFLPTIIVTSGPYANWEFNEVECQELREEDRIDCYPELERPTKRQCQLRGCCWRSVTWDRDRVIPRCFFPGNIGYQVIGSEQTQANGYFLNLQRLYTPHFYQQEVENLQLLVDEQTENRLHFKMYEFRFIEKTERRYSEREDRRWKPNYEIPLETPRADRRAGHTDYIFNYTRNPFHIKVIRKTSNAVMIDTSLGGLVYEEQFLTITMKLPSSTVYGFGEHRKRRLKHEVDWHTWGMFNADVNPDSDSNLYGSHPFFMCIEENGDAFGVLLYNSNAMDIFLSPAPAVTWRTTGGIFDFWMMSGPTPELVIQQYLEIIGRPEIPPYWALGFQMGMENFGNLAELEAMVKRNRDADIPFDVVYGDMDIYQDYVSFTYDKSNYKELPALIEDLHARGQKFALHVMPGVSNQIPDPNDNYHPYYYARKEGIFVNKSDGLRPVRGLSFPGEVEFIDFTANYAKEWWATFLKIFHDEIDFDGLVITYNEPSNFVNGSKSGCENQRWNYPPYVPKLKSEMLYYNTLCMESKQHLGNHYDLHNLYGHYSAHATHFAGEIVWPEVRPMVLSRSTFPGTGRFAGHWLGNNKAEWLDMFHSLVAMVEFNMFGIPFVGANICGFYGNPEEDDDELCQRWMQLGAFYPLSRVYKGRDALPADPASFPTSIRDNMRKYIEERYRILPYLYTCFYHAHVDGYAVARAPFYDFPDDEDVWEVDWEFLLGPALMIVPVMDPGVYTVNAYVPDDRFYDYYTGVQLARANQGRNVSHPAPLDTIPVFTRGGFVIPLQAPGNTTKFSRSNDMSLLISMPEDLDDIAYGDLFWDDGETADSYEQNRDLYLEFFADVTKIEINSERTGLYQFNPAIVDELPVITDIKMYGLISDPGDRIVVDNREIGKDQFTYYDSTEILEIWGLSLDILSDHRLDLGATSIPV